MILEKFPIYQIILKYILNNPNIQKLLKDNKDENYISLYQKVLNEFVNEFIKNINKDKDEIKIYSFINEAKIQQLELNSNIYNYTYRANNFIILNDKLYNLFDYNHNHSKSQTFNIFYRENKIFILFDIFQYKNTILIYIINDK